jgi:hypothetical protein
MSEVKDSNELLNILLILLGLFYIFLAVMEFLAWAGIDFALTSWATGEASTTIQSVLGSQGLVTITLGIFAFIAGVGMFKEQEWALGMALVVLAIIVVNAVSDLIGMVTAGGDFLTGLTFWLTIVALIIAAVGFLWLAFTTERYH